MTIGAMMRLGVGGAGGYSAKVLGYSPIAYWPLWEASGSVAECLVNPLQNGAYTGVTLGQEGIGDGNTCPLFDGLTDFVDIWTATFRNAFSGTEGTAMIWAKVFNVGVWTDGQWRALLNLRADANNTLWFVSTDTNNRLRFRYTAASAIRNRDRDGMTTTDWMVLAITWSVLANEVKFYFNGVQEGAISTSGVWVGLLDNTRTLIGGHSTTPTNPWHGWLGHCIAFDRALPQPTVLDLATV